MARGTSTTTRPELDVANICITFDGSEHLRDVLHEIARAEQAREDSQRSAEIRTAAGHVIDAYEASLAPGSPVHSPIATYLKSTLSSMKLTMREYCGVGIGLSALGPEVLERFRRVAQGEDCSPFSCVASSGMFAALTGLFWVGTGSEEPIQTDDLAPWEFSARMVRSRIAADLEGVHAERFDGKLWAFAFARGFDYLWVDRDKGLSKEIEWLHGSSQFTHGELVPKLVTTYPEQFAIAETTTVVEGQGLVPPAKTPPKQRGGRPSLSPGEEAKRKSVLGRWDHAKANKTAMKDFCADQGVDLKYLNRAINWRAKRQERDDSV